MTRAEVIQEATALAVQSEKINRLLAGPVSEGELRLVCAISDDLAARLRSMARHLSENTDQG